MSALGTSPTPIHTQIGCEDHLRERQQRKLRRRHVARTRGEGDEADADLNHAHGQGEDEVVPAHDHDVGQEAAADGGEDAAEQDRRQHVDRMAPAERDGEPGNPEPGQERQQVAEQGAVGDPIAHHQGHAGEGPHHGQPGRRPNLFPEDQPAEDGAEEHLRALHEDGARDRCIEEAEDVGDEGESKAQAADDTGRPGRADGRRHPPPGPMDQDHQERGREAEGAIEQDLPTRGGVNVADHDSRDAPGRAGAEHQQCAAQVERIVSQLLEDAHGGGGTPPRPPPA